MNYQKKRTTSRTAPQESHVQHAPGGLKGRWMLNSLSFVVCILAAVVIFVSMGISSYYYTNVRSNLFTRATETAGVFRKYWTNSEEQFISMADQHVADFKEKDKLELQFIDRYGRVLCSSSGLATDSIPGTNDVQHAMEEKQISVFTGEDPQTEERVMSVSAPLMTNHGDLIGAVRYITALEAAERQIMVIILIAIVGSLIFLVLVVLSNRYFIKSILEPVMRINIIAKEIAEGRYGMRLHKSYDDEIGELCDTINYMSDEISRAERMKNDFISSVSHELRTPLTAIAGWSETLLAVGATDQEETMQGLEIIQKESHRLTQMVEELLDFSRMESGRMKLEVETFDASIELYEALYMYKNLLEDAGIRVTYEKQEGNYFVSGDRRRIKQVYLNILDNAAKYGKTGGRIEVKLYRDEEHVIAYVRDWGTGIPEAELPFVKEKFYKGSSKQRGSGIGLAVTDEIVTLHGGALEINSHVGEGTAVYIKLPALEAHTARGVEGITEPTEESKP